MQIMYCYKQNKINMKTVNTSRSIESVHNDGFV